VGAVSGAAVGWVLSEFAPRAASQTELLVMIAIANRADRRGQGAWPSVDEISAATLRTTRTAQRVLRSLEARGELAVRAWGRGRGRRRTYEIVGLAGVLPLSTGVGCGAERSPRKGDIRRKKGDTQMSPSTSLSTTSIGLESKNDKIFDLADAERERGLAIVQSIRNQLRGGR
jgi:hypothetical protein